jgi:hypothetical protein
MSIKSIIETTYKNLINEKESRVSTGIDEKAVKEIPLNFFITLISYFFNKLADSIANIKVIIPWIMQTLNVPIFLISFLVPLRESGSLLPQIIIATFIKKLPIRKYIWSIGTFLQALSMIGVGIVAWTMEGLNAGVVIILLIILFSLARGLSSVAAKDVLGKTIPKTRRGVLNGYSGSLAGLLIVVLGIYFLVVGEKPFSAQNFGLLLFLAAFFWIVAAIIYSNIKELEGEIDSNTQGIKDALKKITLLKTDLNFRIFVISRALFLCSVLSAPYFVLLAQQHSNSNNYLLGLFILAGGLADFVSSVFWGKFSDISSKKCMLMGASISSTLGFLVFFLDYYYENIFSIVWIMPLIYFILTIGYQGIRIGRKTYLVDFAEGNKRTDYVAVSNTMIGVILLFTGLFGALSSSIGLKGIILILAIIGIIGIAVASKLPEVQKHNK